MTSTAFLETPMSVFMRLAKTPRAKARTGTLVRLEIAMSAEFITDIIQEQKYRYSTSAIVGL
jgi:hypothetical protein